MTPGGVENLVYAAVLFALIGLGLFAFVRWATKDTSHMTPEEAVSHREKVIKVDKGLAVTNVALAVLNQGIKHAGPARPRRPPPPTSWSRPSAWRATPCPGTPNARRTSPTGSTPTCRPTSCMQREWQPRPHDGRRHPREPGTSCSGYQRPRPLICRQRPGETAPSTSTTT